MLTQDSLDSLGGVAMCASFCKLIRFNSAIVTSSFMKYFMKLFYESDLVGLYQTQSTGISNYNFEAFLKFQAIHIPPKPILSAFDIFAISIIEEKDKLAIATAALRKARDLLLPRLISGKLSVENLDIQFPPSMLETQALHEV